MTVVKNLLAANPSLLTTQAQQDAQIVVQPFLDNNPRAAIDMWEHFDVRATGGFLSSMQDFTIVWSMTIANDTSDPALRAAALKYFPQVPDPGRTVASVLGNPSATRLLALNGANANPDHNGTPYYDPGSGRSGTTD